MKGENRVIMQVYLLRHGIAEDGHSGTADADRALTAEGRRKLRQVLAKAADAGVKPDLIVSSPLKRAVQTAEIAAQALSYKGEIARAQALVPASTPDAVWSEIRAHRNVNSLILVGHNPLFADLAAFLLGTPGVQIEFKKGALMRIDFEHLSPRPKGVLRWYLTARLARNAEKPRS